MEGLLLPKHMTDVVAIQSNEAAFAALRESGRVETWGDPSGGGDSSRVSEFLEGVSAVHASGDIFAAIANGRYIVGWGRSEFILHLRHPLENRPMCSASQTRGWAEYEAFLRSYLQMVPEQKGRPVQPSSLLKKPQT